MDYYKIIPSGDEVDHKIKWNISTIANEDHATGFVLQNMHIKSNISAIKTEEYWEAWPVHNGKIDGAENTYDDNWSPIPSYFILECKSAIQSSKDGIICYDSNVYWIPNGTAVYDEVMRWSSATCSPAGELQTSKEISHDMKDFYVCSRHYQWNYKLLLQKAISIHANNKLQEE